MLQGVTYSIMGITELNIYDCRYDLGILIMVATDPLVFPL
jgi:hypothetical protein